MNDEKKRFKVLRALAFGGIKDPGDIVEMTLAEAQNIGIGKFLSPMDTNTNEEVVENKDATVENTETTAENTTTENTETTETEKVEESAANTADEKVEESTETKAETVQE